MPAKHIPTPESRALVEQLSAFGIPQEDIARVVKIDRKTLALHYPDEIDLGTVKANAKVAGALFKAATGTGQGAITAAIFWLKTRARWKEVSGLEVSGLDGADLKMIHRIELVPVEPEQKDAP